MNEEKRRAIEEEERVRFEARQRLQDDRRRRLRERWGYVLLAVGVLLLAGGIATYSVLKRDDIEVAAENSALALECLANGGPACEEEADDGSEPALLIVAGVGGVLVLGGMGLVLSAGSRSRP